MSQQPLLKKLDEAIERIRFLERENEETLARVRSLDNETKELRRLMALAESKVDEVLRPIPSASPTSTERPSTAKSGKGLQELVQDGTSPTQAEIKRRYA